MPSHLSSPFHISIQNVYGSCFEHLMPMTYSWYQYRRASIALFIHFWEILRIWGILFLISDPSTWNIHNIWKNEVQRYFQFYKQITLKCITVKLANKEIAWDQISSTTDSFPLHRGDRRNSTYWTKKKFPLTIDGFSTKYIFHHCNSLWQFPFHSIYSHSNVQFIIWATRKRYFDLIQIVVLHSSRPIHYILIYLVSKNVWTSLNYLQLYL